MELSIKLKFIIYFFNFLGIFNVTTHGSVFKVSKSLFMINLVIFSVGIFLKYIIPPSFSFPNINDPINVFKDLSVLFFMLVTLVGIAIDVIGFLLIIVLMWKLGEVISLIQACKTVFHRFELSEKSDLFISFRRKCFKVFYQTVSFTFFLKLTYVLSVYKLNYQSFILQWVYTGRDNISLYFMLVISFFLLYFLFLLKIQNVELENANNCVNSTNAGYQKLISRYLDILRLIIAFNKIFGFLLSIVTSFVILTTTFTVIYKHLK